MGPDKLKGDTCGVKIFVGLVTPAAEAAASVGQRIAYRQDLEVLDLLVGRGSAV